MAKRKGLKCSRMHARCRRQRIDTARFTPTRIEWKVERWANAARLIRKAGMLDLNYNA